MRQENALYGGEMSAHHYFRDFGYCDSGMIPWLLVAELVSRTGQSLSELVKARQQAFPCSGELNYQVTDASIVRNRIEQYFSEPAGSATEMPKIEHVDGLSMEFSDWRFNLRSSNTEPLLRLNVETRANPEQLAEKVRLLESLIKAV